MFELSNDQRHYFGLEPVSGSWDKVRLSGDTYRLDSILYFEGNTIKKQLVSTETEYKEIQFNEETDNRTSILPKTRKGKPKKLTASVLESRKPKGVYLNVNSNGGLVIGNHNTNTIFYSRDWEYAQKPHSDLSKLIIQFIKNSPSDHLERIKDYSNAKRKNVKYKSGDFFAFKLNRFEYGYGRILFDINKARKKKLISSDHGLNLLMGPPVLIKIYAYKSNNKSVDIHILKQQKSLPSDYIMDNVIFYGEYEIIGNLPVEIHEFDFPMSYGTRIDQTPNVFLQWGLIHRELPKKKFNKYLNAINENLPENNPSRFLNNPYSYYGIGFRPRFDNIDIIEFINSNGHFDYSKGKHYMSKWDLRNPKNDSIRSEIMKVFGIDPDKSYNENCKITMTKDVIELIEEMG